MTKHRFPTEIEHSKNAQPVDPVNANIHNAKPINTATTTWGPIVGVVYSLGVAFIGGSIFSALLVSFLLSAFGMSKYDIDSWSSSAVGALLYSLVTAIIAIGIIAFYITKSKGNWRSIGVIPPRWKHVGLAVLAVMIYLMLYVVIITVIKMLVPAINLDQQQDLGITAPQNLTEILLVFVTLVVLPPIVEETIFRGFMYSGLRSKLPFITSALVTSVLFALGHLQFGSGAPLLWVAAIDTFVLSMVMCYVRERTGSIIPTMIMHALKNLIAFSFLYVFV